MYTIVALTLACHVLFFPMLCYGQEPAPFGSSQFFKGPPFSEEKNIRTFTGEREKGGALSPLGAPLFEPRFGPKSPLDGVIKSRDTPSGKFEDPCPRSERLAKKKAEADVGVFLRKTPLGTWSLFMHKFRQQYSGCPPFVKRAYLKAAKDIILPKQKAMFVR